MWCDGEDIGRVAGAALLSTALHSRPRAERGQRALTATGRQTSVPRESRAAGSGRGAVFQPPSADFCWGWGPFLMAFCFLQRLVASSASRSFFSWGFLQCYISHAHPGPVTAQVSAVQQGPSKGGREPEHPPHIHTTTHDTCTLGLFFCYT